MNILSRFSGIDTFIFDVDGVLTNGGVLVLESGEMARIMNTKDGYAMQLAIKKGYRVIIITGSSPSAVKQRMNNLGIEDVFFSVTDKKGLIEKLAIEKRLIKEKMLYMGDDMPDLPAFEAVGLNCCPADAVVDIKNAAHYISTKRGGEGCVRDVIEKVMKMNNHWGVEEGVASK